MYVEFGVIMYKLLIFFLAIWFSPLIALIFVNKTNTTSWILGFCEMWLCKKNRLFITIKLFDDLNNIADAYDTMFN